MAPEGLLFVRVVGDGRYATHEAPSFRVSNVRRGQHQRQRASLLAAGHADVGSEGKPAEKTEHVRPTEVAGEGGSLGVGG